jgi:hypothetical protein
MNFTMINELLEKYWEGESSLEQERRLKEYFASENVAEEHKKFAPLFGFYAKEKASQIDLSLEKTFREGETAEKVDRGRIFTMPRYLFSIAASIALVVCSVFIFKHFNQLNEHSYVSVEGQVEDLESEEALQLAEEALLFLSGKLNKGSKTVKKNLIVTKKGQLFK